jgi:hypothetical protein
MIRCDQTICVAETGPVCVVIWRGAVTKMPFEWQRAGLAETVQRHPRGAAFMCVVEMSAKPPDDELRKASAQLVLSHGDRLKCTACVIEGEGFLTAMHRGALTGMILLTMKRKSLISVFATVREGARWMREQLMLPPEEELISSVEYIRSRFPSSS